MKKIKTRILAMLLVFAMVMSTAVLTPTTASAATAKTKSTTLKVTDTKISGFESIYDIITLNSKYVIAYGRNSKGKTVYSYSTDGKNFTKAISVGMDGYVYFICSGKNLYAIQHNSTNPTQYYKCVTNPKSLKSAKAISISAKCKLPSTVASINSYSFNGGFSDEKTGKYYFSIAQYCENKDGSYGSYPYLVTLNKGTVSAVSIADKAASLLKVDVSDVYSYPAVTMPYDSTSFKAIISGSYTTKSGTEKDYMLYTSNGKTFKLCPSVPNKKSTQYYTSTWMGSTFVYYCNGYAKNGKIVNLLPADSKNRGYYYLYDAGKNKWVKKTTGKANKAGFITSGYDTDSYVTTTFVNSSSSKPSMYFAYKMKGSKSKVIYSSNAKTWKALPTLKWNSTSATKNYTLYHVEFHKTTSGTYAIEHYLTSTNSSAGKCFVISKLNGNSWKKVTTIKQKSPTNGTDSLFTNLNSKNPTLIYNSGKTSTAYNLKSKKSYKLPFTYNYNYILTGDKTIHYASNKFYTSSNGFKNVSKITLKAGSKKISKKIQFAYTQTVSKNTYVYIYTGSKVYYTTLKKMLK